MNNKKNKVEEVNLMIEKGNMLEVVKQKFIQLILYIDMLDCQPEISEEDIVIFLDMIRDRCSMCHAFLNYRLIKANGEKYDRNYTLRKM